MSEWVPYHTEDNRQRSAANIVGHLRSRADALENMAEHFRELAEDLEQDFNLPPGLSFHLDGGLVTKEATK